ncbi:MAG: hypothetical protein AMXMBFR59_40290 [Rhodanobacteraceae bacterium]
MAAKLFISYAHEDEAYKNKLLSHLTMLKREGLIEPWNDRTIMAGDDFSAAIDGELAKADIILLLVSANFIQSAYCYSREMTRAMDLHSNGLARVIPVIVRPCDWHKSPFGHLTAAPRDGKPITTWSNDDEAYLDVANQVRRAAHKAGAQPPEPAIPLPMPPAPAFRPRSRPSARTTVAVAAACAVGAAAYWQPWRGSDPRGPARPVQLTEKRAATTAVQAAVPEAVPSRGNSGAGSRKAGDSTAPQPVQGAASAPPTPSANGTWPHVIHASEGVIAIAEIAVAAAPGEAWDPGTKALAQLPDVLLCFRQAAAGRETCRPTLGGMAGARTVAHGNTSHVADVFADMTEWNATFWVELKNQDWREARTMGRAECRFGVPCPVTSARDGRTPIGEVIVLPALHSDPATRVRYLEPCADRSSLLAQQAAALVQASAREFADRPPSGAFSYDALARTFLAAAEAELPPVAIEETLESGRRRESNAASEPTYRGTFFQRAAADPSRHGDRRGEIERALAVLRRDIGQAGVLQHLSKGCD